MSFPKWLLLARHEQNFLVFWRRNCYVSLHTEVPGSKIYRREPTYSNISQHIVILWDIVLYNKYLGVRYNDYIMTEFWK